MRHTSSWTPAAGAPARTRLSTAPPAGCVGWWRFRPNGQLSRVRDRLVGACSPVPVPSALLLPSSGMG